MARIADLLAAGRTYSFEFFPPKSDAEHARLVETLMELQPLRPSFVSVTYRGGRSSRQRTHDLVVGMLRTTTPDPDGPSDLRGPYPAGAGRDPGRVPQGRRREPHGPRRRPADRSRTPPKGSWATPSSWSSWPGPSAGSRSGWRPTPPATPARPTCASDRDYLAEKLRLADFARHPVLLPGRRSTCALVDDLAARGVSRPRWCPGSCR